MLTSIALDGRGRSPGDHARRRDAVRGLAYSLARGSAAIDLRMARLCCAVQGMDLRPLGYSSFGSFIRERVDWQPSWQRLLARLLRSDLDLIKRAVVEGLVTLTAAVQAPGRVSPDDQVAWLQQVLAGVRSPSRCSTDVTDVLVGDDADTVRRARRLARLLLGRRVPDRICDQQIIDWFRQGARPEDLLRDAVTPPPLPDLSPATWPDDGAQPGLPGDGWNPAEELLGPWRQPRSLTEAVEMLDAARAVRSKRRAALGRLLDEIRSCWFFLDWGYERFDDWVQSELDLSVRTAWRLRRLGRSLAVHPELGDAVDGGALSVARAQALGRLATTGRQTRAWLKVVDHLPMNEVLAATRDDAPADRLRRYQSLLDDAPDLVRRAMRRRAAAGTVLDGMATDGDAALPGTGAAPGGTNPTPPATTGAPALGPQTTADIRVALAEPSDDADARRVRAIHARAGLLEACRWLLDTVQIPRQRGCGRIKELQSHTCQNPECRRRSLRNHAHHDKPRALGGTDDLDNLRCLCPGCHLRLVHGGYLAIVRVDDAHVYLYPGRAVVVR